MNRMEEYEQLVQETTPPTALEGVVSRALARSRQWRTGRRAAMCACAPLAVLVVFTALVNLLPGFALACQKVPVLKELARAVSFSPSLSAAVENGYVQMIGQEQTKDGITMRVEYVIADEKQWYVFYKLQQPNGNQCLSIKPHLKDINGNDLQGTSSAWGDMSGGNDDTIRSVAIYFIERDAPEALRLECEVSAEKRQDQTEPPQQSASDDLTSIPVQPASIASFDFELRIETSKLYAGEAYPQNKTFSLDGQRLTLKQVEVYPTHVLVSFEDDPANSAWLTSVQLHLVDEHGKRYDHLKGGISATGSVTPMTPNYYIESPYFSHGQRLTLYIDGATWLEKDRQRARIDLKNGTAEGLPDGVTLSNATRNGGNWVLEFQEKVGDSPIGGIFDWNYWDEQGREYRFTQNGTTTSGAHDGLPAMASERFALVDYPYDVVYMGLGMTRIIIEAQPVVIPVK